MPATAGSAALVEKLARESDPLVIAKLVCDAIAERDRALEAMGRELAEARAEFERLKTWHSAALDTAESNMRVAHAARIRATTAERLLSESQAEGRRKDERIKVLEEALSEIIAREDKAWKPVRVFRSEQEAELDDARHETWTEAADIARTALAARDEGNGR